MYFINFIYFTSDSHFSFVYSDFRFFVHGVVVVDVDVDVEVDVDVNV